MGNITLYIATSLDGYIADSDGKVGWLDDFQDEDYGFDDFFKDIDIILMGGRTYRQILTFGENWPYPETKTIVYSHREELVADIENKDITFRNYINLEEISELKSKNNIWLVGGAKLAKQFFDSGNIDVVDLFEVPVFINNGILLQFDRTGYNQVHSHTYENRVRRTKYTKNL